MGDNIKDLYKSALDADSSIANGRKDEKGNLLEVTPLEMSQLDMGFKEGGAVKRLKFPADILSNSSKRFKSMSLFILKDASYVNIVKNITDEYEKIRKGESDISSGETLTDSEMKEAENKGPSGVMSAIYNKVAGVVGEGAKKITTAVGVVGKAAAKEMPRVDECASSDFHAVITLPIPNNLTEDDGHSYEESSWDKSLFEKGVSFVNKTTDGFSNIAQTGAQFGNTMLRRQSKQLAQIPILNPFTWKKFQGSQLKTFRFTIFFVPRSKEEAAAIMEIVYLLKKYSYGSMGGAKTQVAWVDKLSDFFVSAPPKILLTFGNPMLQKLLNPGICVIENIGTTYNEGNTVGMTADGIPRFIEVNIALSEYNVRFQEDFNAI